MLEFRYGDHDSNNHSLLYGTVSYIRYFTYIPATVSNEQSLSNLQNFTL